MSSSSTSDSTAARDHQAPLLRPRQDASPSARPTALAVLLGRITGHHAPSMLVRETAARAFEERRIDWGYSKPVVAADILWNVALVAASAVMVVGTVEERPNEPIRVWICGYGLQCLIHVALVWSEYWRRNTRRRDRDLESGDGLEGSVGYYNSEYGHEEEEEDGDNSTTYRFGLNDDDDFDLMCSCLFTMMHCDEC